MKVNKIEIETLYLDRILLYNGNILIGGTIIAENL